MAINITFANQKGGVAKTSTGIVTGQLLFCSNKKVLFVDMDAQGNLSHTLRAKSSKGTIMDLLSKNKSTQEVIQKTYSGDCICYSPALSGADKTLDGLGKEYLLKEALEQVKDDYSFIIIDPPPALGLLTINALVSSNYVVIPSQADIYSLQGISQVFLTIDSIKKYCNSSLKISGILLTRFNGHTILSKELSQLIEDTAQKLQTKVFKSRIRECVAVKEAEAGQLSLFKHAPKSNASIDYCAFINELIGDIYAKEKSCK